MSSVPSGPPDPSPAFLAQNNAPYILTVLGVIGGLALVVTFLRLFVRRCMLRHVGSDDWVMALAMFWGLTTYACFIGESRVGLGRHDAAITPVMATAFGHWVFYHSLLILAGICSAKVSICLLLIRLVKRTNYGRFLWVVIVALIVYHLVCMGTIIFACIPVAGNWNPAVREHAKCYSLQTYTNLGIANSSINLITDVLLAFLPIPVILKLQVSRMTKFGLCFVMLLGFAAVGAGIVKLKAQIDFLDTTDRYFNDTFFVWAGVELYCAILAASLPMLRPLFIKAFTQARSLTDSLLPSRRPSAGAVLMEDRPPKGSSGPASSSDTTSTTPATDIGYFERYLRKPSADTISAPPRGGRPVDTKNSFIWRASSDASDNSDLARGITRTTEMVTVTEEVVTPAERNSAIWDGTEYRVERSPMGKQRTPM